MGRFATSWELTKTSWGVVKQDRELLWMPVLSFIASAAVLLSMLAITLGLTPHVFTGEGEFNALNAVISLSTYLLLAFVGVYFHAAVVAAAKERLDGGDPTLGSAFRVANQHIGKLFLWAVMVATVNMILQVLRDRGGIVGQIAASLGGAAWNLATFFVVPHLLFSDDGVGTSLKESAGLFRRRWGETAVGHFGLGFAIGLLVVGWVLLGMLLTALLAGLGVIGLAIGLTLTIGGAIFIGLLGTVLSAVYKVALYRHAKGEDTGAFTGLERAVY